MHHKKQKGHITVSKKSDTNTSIAHPTPLLCLENEVSLGTCQNKKQNRSKLNFPKKAWLACDFSVDFHPL